MIRVDYDGVSIQVQKGDVLRDALMANGLLPHDEGAEFSHCKGGGTCGTCLVHIQGSVTDLTETEKKKLQQVRACSSQGHRLACQVKLLGDTIVNKACK